MPSITVKPRYGVFAGEEVFTDKYGYGIFTYVRGSIIQHTGLSQTPKFKNAAQLSRFLRTHYNY